MLNLSLNLNLKLFVNLYAYFRANLKTKAAGGAFFITIFERGCMVTLLIEILRHFQAFLWTGFDTQGASLAFIYDNNYFIHNKII